MSKRSAAAVVDVWADDAPAIACAREFTASPDGDLYVLKLIDVPINFKLRQVRNERGDMLARLTVRTKLTGARTHGEVLNVSTLNLSSAQARAARAKLLENLSRAPQVDWHRLIEELAIRVFEHQDQGEPATDLATVPDPGEAADDTFSYYGVVLPTKHPSILFGDGGAMKSFLALVLAIYLSRAGLRVGFFDWELFDRDHARRLRMLCGADPLPSILHVRCVHPLIHECERLRRIARHEALDFAIFDSVGFATQGAPENAEAALGYMQAANIIGIGGLHVAHVTKTGDQSDKPFGSSFWHHSARCTWNVKLERDDTGSRRRVLGLFNRKFNLGDIQPPVGLAVTFESNRVIFAPTDLAQTAELVTGLPLWRRIQETVKRRPLTLAAIADELGAKTDSVERIVRRHKGVFTRVPSTDGIQRIALVENRS